MEPPYLVIGGATAVGKSQVALEAADRLNGEIVIADSRQVYRGLDIGTAKPTPAERARVPHHVVDRVELGTRYSAADYARDAREAIRDIQQRGRTAIVCGGTGFYLAALAGALDAMADEAEPAGSAAARALAEGIPAAERHAVLADVDPESARRLHPRDRQRVVRALEVYFLADRPLSELQTGGHEPPPHLSLQVVRPREELRQRIERRFRAMLEAGLEAEVRALWQAGWTPQRPGLDTIGYREWWPYFEGRANREVVSARILRATHAYAKRQRTWFRNQGDYRPVPPETDTVVAAWLGYLDQRAQTRDS